MLSSNQLLKKLNTISTSGQITSAETQELVTKLNGSISEEKKNQIMKIFGDIQNHEIQVLGPLSPIFFTTIKKNS